MYIAAPAVVMHFTMSNCNFFDNQLLPSGPTFVSTRLANLVVGLKGGAALALFAANTDVSILSRDRTCGDRFESVINYICSWTAWLS